MNTNIDKISSRYVLYHEYKQREKKNQAYSLRAFARFLGVSPAYVSQIFARKRILSELKAKDFAKRFKWNAKKRNLFFALIQYEKTIDPQLKADFLEQIENLSDLDFLELQEDQFQLIAEGYHYSILELTNVKDFCSTPDWIAKRLGISTIQVEEGIQRLLRLGLLNRDAGGLKKSSPNLKVKEIPSNAVKSFHQEKLRLAAEALEKQDSLERDFLGVTLSICKKDIPQIRELSRDFIERLMKLSDKSKPQDSVYHLSTQFFRLDKERDQR